MPLTYEGILELYRQTALQIQENAQQMRETDRQIRENARRMAEQSQETDRQIEATAQQIRETAKQIKQTNKDVGGLTSSIGEIVANMVRGNIIEKFEALGYHNLDDYCEKKKFKNKKLGIKGEIDIFLENGEIAILIEVKTTLEVRDVRDHIERLEKFRRYTDARGVDSRRFIGAVAGGIVNGDAADFALESGLYVIVQSGDAVEILPQPEGFTAKKW